MVDYPLLIRKGRNNRPISYSKKGKIVLFPFSTTTSLKEGDIILPLKVDDKGNYYLCQKFLKVNTPFLFKGMVYYLNEGEITDSSPINNKWVGISYSIEKVKVKEKEIVITLVDSNFFTETVTTLIEKVNIEILREAKKTEEQEQQLINFFEKLVITENEFKYENKYLGEEVKVWFYGKVIKEEVNCNKEILQKLEKWKKDRKKLHQTVIKILRKNRKELKQRLEKYKKQLTELRVKKEQYIKEFIEKTEFEEEEKVISVLSGFTPYNETEIEYKPVTFYKLKEIEGEDAKKVSEKYLVTYDSYFKNLIEKIDKLRKEIDRLKLAVTYGEEHHYLFSDFVNWLISLDKIKITERRYVKRDI